MEVLQTKYQLGLHCGAVRRYLLLGQGDFVQALMDLVSLWVVLVGFFLRVSFVFGLG